MPSDRADHRPRVQGYFDETVLPDGLAVSQEPDALFQLHVHREGFAVVSQNPVTSLGCR